jgi:dipeptidyl aminopeptidase/acylaminoacyl peptidase
LPEHVEEIPLEYFFNAIDWIKQKPIINSEKICIAGGSKGGELALLLASMDLDISGVIAIAPSHVIWQGLPHNPFNILWPNAAWTLNGEDLPYMEHEFYWPTIWKFINGGNQIELMPFYINQIKDEEKVQKSLIAVENINGPILFIAGKEDCVWPSYTMCKLMEHRLDSLNYQYPVEGLYYDNTGHQVISPYLWPTIDYIYEGTKFGGTNSANANSQIDSWNKMIQFLKRYFPPEI